jgi:hypothetical protein
MSASETPHTRNAPPAGATATAGGIHRVEIDDAMVTDGDREQSTRRYLVDGNSVANLDALPPAIQAEVRRMLAEDGKPGATAGAAAAGGAHRVQINDLEISESGRRQSTRSYLVDGKPMANLDALPPAMQAEVKRLLAEDGKPDNTGPATPRMSITSIQPETRSRMSLKVVIAIAIVLALSFMLGKMLS